MPNVRLTNELPKAGIIIAHPDHIEPTFLPSKNQVLVCTQADRGRHPTAQVHIVQNPVAVLFKSLLNQISLAPLGVDYFMRHWPQPKLIPRSPDRGNLFENIGYLGVKSNIVPELQSADWSKELASLGFNWVVRSEQDQWNNYGDLDCVVAVRSFQKNEINIKPATKLYNSWLAQVPAVLDSNSAYEFERKSTYDYLQAKKVEDILVQIKRLKNDPEFRRQILENAKTRALEVSVEATTKQWIQLLSHEIPKYLDLWRSSNFYRNIFFASRKSWYGVHRIASRLRNPF